MGHDHRHERRGGQRNQGRPLTITLALVLVYMSLEVVGGLLSPARLPCLLTPATCCRMPVRSR